jgi:hypothetical protein
MRGGRSQVLLRTTKEKRHDFLVELAIFFLSGSGAKLGEHSELAELLAGVFTFQLSQQRRVNYICRMASALDVQIFLHLLCARSDFIDDAGERTDGAWCSAQTWASLSLEGRICKHVEHAILYLQISLE